MRWSSDVRYRQLSEAIPQIEDTIYSTSRNNMNRVEPGLDEKGSLVLIFLSRQVLNYSNLISYIYISRKNEHIKIA
jgi:hypothetical protein